MRKTTKRILAVLLATLLTALCLGGCVSGPEYSFEEYGNGATAPEPQFASRPTLPTMPQLGGDEEEDTQPATTEPAAPQQTGELIAVDGEEISYVLVYNPDIYWDDYNDASRNTGAIASQINVDMNRADDLTGEPAMIPYKQVEISQEFLDKLNQEGDRANGLGKIYQVGDQEVFYGAAYGNVNARAQHTLVCAYTGTHTNIWVESQMDQAVIDRLGKTFDTTTYDACVSRFGEARFGDVVNILLYNFGEDTCGGFFYSHDLFATADGFTEAEIAQYGMNMNMNIININTAWLVDEEAVISALAHEFQHLLCFTSATLTGNVVESWFNEAMSGYIEEVLYPGIKENHFALYHYSQLIRYGQSLYNFYYDNYDFGVYGSVFLFSEYMKNLDGNDVFSRFYKNWRSTFMKNNTIEGIYKTVNASTRQKIDNMFNYPSTLKFDTAAEEWVSKLTLSFYLSTFTKDEYTPEYYRNIRMEYLTYDSLQNANIEGGGRVIIATKDGTFTIPENADEGLIFVGLNEDLEIVTDIICS